MIGGTTGWGQPRIRGAYGRPDYGAHPQPAPPPGVAIGSAEYQEYLTALEAAGLWSPHAPAPPPTAPETWQEQLAAAVRGTRTPKVPAPPAPRVLMPEGSRIPRGSLVGTAGDATIWPPAGTAGAQVYIGPMGPYEQAPGLSPVVANGEAATDWTGPLLGVAALAAVGGGLWWFFGKNKKP